MDKRFNSVTIGHEPPWAASPVSKTALQTFRFLDIWLVGWLVGWLGPKELVEGWTRHHFPSLVRTETSDPDPGWLVVLPPPVSCWSVIFVSLVFVFEFVVSLNVICFSSSSFLYRFINTSFLPRLSCHCPSRLVPGGTRDSCFNFVNFYRYRIFFLCYSDHHGSGFFQTHSSTMLPQ